LLLNNFSNPDRGAVNEDPKSGVCGILWELKIRTHWWSGTLGSKLSVGCGGRNATAVHPGMRFFSGTALRFLVGIRYNVIRVYPLFWSTKSKTINFFELRKIST